MDEEQSNGVQSPSGIPLKDKPVLSLEEVGVLIGLPLSSLMEILDECPMPVFLMGRRRKVLASDLDAWLLDVKDRFPWTPRVNNRKHHKR